MYVFVDTEFSNFDDLDPISLAAVAEDGQKFYVEFNMFETYKNSQFVNFNVLPHLLGGEYVKSFNEASAAFAEWLDELGADFEIITDYHGDVQITKSMLESFNIVNLKRYTDITAVIAKLINSASVHSKEVSDEVNKYKARCKEYFDLSGKVQHMSLNDAEAMLYAWVFARRAYLGA